MGLLRGIIFLALGTFSGAAAAKPKSVAETCSALKNNNTSVCRHNMPLTSQSSAIFAISSTDCGDPVIMTTVSLEQVTPTAAFPTAHQKCSITVENKDGTREDRYLLSLGTSLTVKVDTAHNVSVSVDTPSGRVTCTQIESDPQNPSLSIYKSCTRRLNGETQFTRVPDITQEQLQQLMAKTLLLTQLDTPGAKPLELRGSIISQ